jgi:hypothetical protein
VSVVNRRLELRELAISRINGLNHFQLYDRATRAYLASSLNIARLTPEMLAQLADVKERFPKAFRSSPAIDYSKVATRLVYSLHYAPKHATIWEMWLLRSQSPLRGAREFISLGTGPGAEVFGIIEANRPPPGSTVTVHCLERASEWTPIFAVAREEFTRETNVEVRARYYDDVTQLPARLPVVGSLFLSELIRDGNLHEFLQQLRNTVRPSSGLFLDNVLCTARSGTRDVVYGVPELMGFANFPNYLPGLGLGISARCNADSEAARCVCHVELPGEPTMCFMLRPLP